MLIPVMPVGEQTVPSGVCGGGIKYGKMEVRNGRSVGSTGQYRWGNTEKANTDALLKSWR